MRGRRGLLPMRGRGGGGMMMNRGGGGPPRRGGPTGPTGPLMGAAPRPPFDLTLCEPMFPKVAEVDDSALTQALLKRNTDLSPTAAEQTAIMNLVNKVNSALEKLIVTPESFTAASIEEVRPVGSFKKGTMTTKHNVADLVIVLKTLPTMEAVNALGTRVIEDIKAAAATESRGEVLGFIPRDFGCEIAGTHAVVRLLISTIPSNFKKLDPTLHLNAKLLQNHVAAIRHARYFEENASHSSVKVLVRILKDIRNRFHYLQPLNVWMIELLAYYAIMNTPNHQPLPLNQAFRRCFQLLAAGIFLPGSAGIIDPCEPNAVRVQSYMTPEEQDVVSLVSQTLLRVLCHGGYKQILGFEGTANVATEMSVWDGVVVSPLDKVYEANLDEPGVVAGSGMDYSDFSAN